MFWSKNEFWDSLFKTSEGPTEKKRMYIDAYSADSY